MIRKLMVFVALVFVSSGACGSSDNKAATVDVGTTSSASASDESAGDLRAKLLTVADMPTGYSATSAEEDDGGGSNASGCPELDAYDAKYKNKSEEVQVDFQKGEPSLAGGQFVGETVERLPSKAEAKEAFAAAVDAFQKCKQFETTNSDGSKLTGSMSALSFPRLEDDTFAVHMKVKVDSPDGFSVDMAGDMIAVRSGRLTAIIVSFGFGGASAPISEVESIVRKAVAKL